MIALNPNHPALSNQNITKLDRIKGFFEKYELHADLITGIALTAILGTAFTVTGIAPFVATILLCVSLSAALIVATHSIFCRSVVNAEKSKQSISDLHVAVREKKYFWLKAALSDPTIDKTIKNRTEGYTALHSAVAEGDRIATALLLRHKSFLLEQINERTKKNLAAYNFNDETERNDRATALAAHSVEMHNIKNANGIIENMGRNCLQISISRSDLQMVQLLLKNGANPSLQDPYKRNALEFAEKEIVETPYSNRSQIIELLRDALKDPKWNRGASQLDSKT